MAGSIILLLSFAVRASFGVFQIPIAGEFGWPRSAFSTAIAIQNLAGGLGQPIFGALAEKLGARRARVRGGAEGQAAQVQSMKVRRDGAMRSYRFQNGELTQGQSRMQARDGSGAGKNNREQWQRGSSGNGNCRGNGGGSRGSGAGGSRGSRGGGGG